MQPTASHEKGTDVSVKASHEKGTDVSVKASHEKGTDVSVKAAMSSVLSNVDKYSRETVPCPSYWPQIDKYSRDCFPGLRT